MNGQSLPKVKTGYPLFVWLRSARRDGHKFPMQAVLDNRHFWSMNYVKQGDVAEEMFYRFIRRNPNKYLACFNEIGYVFTKRYAPTATRTIAPWGFGFYRADDDQHKLVDCDQPKGMGRFHWWLDAKKNDKVWNKLSKDEQTARILLKQIGVCLGN